MAVFGRDDTMADVKPCHEPHQPLMKCEAQPQQVTLPDFDPTTSFSFGLASAFVNYHVKVARNANAFVD